MDVPAVINRFADSIEPSLFTFSAVGIFQESQPVAFLASKVTPELLDLQARIARELLPLTSGWRPYYSPEAWVPHCTLSMAVAASQWPPLAAVHLPILARATAMSLVEFPPAREIHAVRFD